jgi:hypothetical protein
MSPTFLERKIFQEEEQVAIKYLRGVLQLSQRQLATLAHVDTGTMKRAENPYATLRYLSAARLIDTLNSELQKQGHLGEDKQLQLRHIAMHVS